MMKYLKYFLSLLIILVIYVIRSQTAFGYQFPVPELGNCRDQKECFLYCQIPLHKPACWSYGVYATKENVLGETTVEESLSRLGIAFPVPELGNCANFSSCRKYCQDEQHRQQCHTFAADHGLIKKQKILEKAKQELGCSSLDECRQFCESDTNQDLCRNFARRYHLKLKFRILQQTRAELGCNSVSDCKNFCRQPENRDKCRQFAQKHQIRNQTRVDCRTIDDCRKICEQDPNRCPRFPRTSEITNATPTPLPSQTTP